MMSNESILEKIKKAPDIVSHKDNIASLFEKMKPEMAKALPKHLNAERMARIGLTEIRKNPALLECSQASLLAGIMTAAQLGLEPGILGHVYLIPYNNNKTRQKEVQFMIGYKGILELVRRSGQVASIDVHEVCKGDDFEFEYGLEPKLRHKPNLDNRGEEYAYYAVAKLKDGGYQFLVMSKKDVEKYKARSKSPNYGPWQSDYGAMAKKTVLKQLCKYLPISLEYQEYMAQDETTKKVDIEKINKIEDVMDAKDITDWEIPQVESVHFQSDAAEPPIEEETN
jgi:recombination protein RecT